jgi:hypothetical protein
MRTVVAIDAHEIPRRAPVRVVAGDEVTASERDAQWPAFVFVTATQGAGSVPARQLSADAGPATVLTPYDTTELPTQPGQILTMLHEDPESGWHWCRDASRRERWVPARSLRDRV